MADAAVPAGELAPVPWADPSWLGERLKRPVETVTLEDMSGSGGYSADMQRLHVQFCDGTSMRLVLKQTNGSRIVQSQQLGLARESLFYQQLAGQIASGLATVVWSHGDLESGEKKIIMEDLSDTVQAGYFFGPGSPHNWDKDLTDSSRGWGLEAGRITVMAYEMAARVHAAFWREEALLGTPWLRGSAWLQGKGQDAWEASQAQASTPWAAVRQALPAEGGGEVNGIRWDPLVVSCIDASLAKANFETFQLEIKQRPWTLVHGDFHPANMMVRRHTSTSAEEEFDLVLLDWEVVGLGSGPQDLGQFAISHTDPAVRASTELEAVRAYHTLLLSLCPRAAEELPWEACWTEYVQGGVGRWMWFLPLMTTMCPGRVMQYFHDQVLEFIKSHGVTAANVPMPRV